MKLPATLTLNNRTLQGSGPGRSAGSHLYLDLSSGQTHELYLAQVESTGPVFSLAAIAANPAIRQVRVEHGALQGGGQPHVGEVLLVEPDFAQFTSGRLLPAKAAWLLVVHPSARPIPRPAPRPAAPASRCFGTLTEIHGNFGYLIEERSGDKVFIHRHQVVDRPFRPGTRVSYRRSQNTQGPCAAEVKSA